MALLQRSAEPPPPVQVPTSDDVARTAFNCRLSATRTEAVLSTNPNSPSAGRGSSAQEQRPPAP
eukprot:4306870-Lingulodinium_polyedra.AAC.1